MSNTNSLNSRQWSLYYLIKGSSMKGESLSIKQICEIMPEEYRYNPSESNFSNCPTIYKDIDAINASNEIDNIVIKNNNNIKLATEEEAVSEAKRIQIRALKLLKKYWAIHERVSLNGKDQLALFRNESAEESPEEKKFFEVFKI